MMHDADVIIIGAGAGGPVVAKELGEKGIKVLLLEAGPWYGNEKWPNPNQEQGAVSSSDIKDLSNEVFNNCFTSCECEMNDCISGKFRWGAADRNKPPWFRNIPLGGFAWQNSGVGGTTLTYLGISPRAYPIAIDKVWPISYNEIVPYYEKVEETLPVITAPMTAKEELFFHGAKKAGWSLLKTPDVTSPGYRLNPNAILPPDPNINDSNLKFDGNTKGCTLCGHCINGCSIGPSVEEKAKRSTLVSYIPLALKTGVVEVRPNTFVIRVLTETSQEGIRATGVMYRDTWTGEIGEFTAKSVVMAAGALETPRLWLNSELPNNPWAGKGLTNHWTDCVSGIFDEKVLMDILGVSDVKPFVGQNSGARLDYPGLGMLMGFGMSPGLQSSMLYAASKNGYNFLRKPNPKEPWDVVGRVVNAELKELMAEYPRTLSIMILIDDGVKRRNRVILDSVIKDEHGPISLPFYLPGVKDLMKRNKLASFAADILKKAGAKKIIHTDWPPDAFAHLQSTMRIGYVTDENCEALQVKRLFIADNSVLQNSLGGSNPTLTTQALATRTAEKLADKYFS